MSTSAWHWAVGIEVTVEQENPLLFHQALTITLTALEVVVAPALSVAIAVIEYVHAGTLVRE